MSLLAVNYGEVPPESSYRAFIAAATAAIVGLGMGMLWLRNRHKAAALTALGALLFFSYGHLYGALETVHVVGIQLGRHRYLVPLYIAVFGVLAFRLARIEGDGLQLTRILGPIGVVLLVVSTAMLAVRIIRSGGKWTLSAVGGEVGTNSIQRLYEGQPPDIYYIVLDGYARPDVMRDSVGFDLRNFTESLQDLGFEIAERSNSNYMWTALSLSSSMNMRYIQEFRIPLSFGSYPAVFADPIQHSQLRTELEQYGYTVVAFESGYLPTEIEDADYFVQSTDERVVSQRGLNAFEMQLASTSGALVVTDFLGPSLYKWVGFRTDLPHSVLREIILDSFQGLEDVAALPSPKFVFAHIVSPHSPYLFGSNGEYLEPDGPITFIDQPDDRSKGEKYRAQAIYITRLAERAIRSILSESVRPPVIIVQADHGPGLGVDWQAPGGRDMWQRFAILNAYHLPHGCDRYVYPEISPVNTFRIVLACYLGANYRLVEDRSYFSYWPRTNPYVFIDVSAQLDGGAK